MVTLVVFALCFISACLATVGLLATVTIEPAATEARDAVSGPTGASLS